MIKAVLVCGGTISDYDHARKIIENCDFQIAVDSGADHFWELGLKPDILIGDFDSISEEVATVYSSVEKISFPPEKSMTDTELAIRYSIENGYKSLVILGALGSRVDHMLANIAMLGLIDDLGCVGVIEDGNQSIYLLTENNNSFSKQFRSDTILSLLPLTEKVVGVNITGVKYPLSNATLTRDSSLGISNEVEGTVNLTMKSGKLLVILGYQA